MQATVTDDVRPLRAMDQLRRRFPHALVLSFAPSGAVDPATPRPRTTGLSDHQIALGFVEELRGAPASEQESRLLLDACEAVRDDPADTLVAQRSG